MRRSLAVLLIVALSGCMQWAEPPADEVTPGWPQYNIALDVPLAQPMFQGDIRRTGWFPEETVPAAVELAWEVVPFNQGPHSAAKGSAVQYDDVLYAGTDAGVIHAVDRDGQVLWQAQAGQLPRGTHGTPLVYGDALYIGAYDGALYALDRHTGERSWRSPLGGSVASSPLIFEGLLYVATETSIPSGILHVVDPDDGSVVWMDGTIGDHPHSSVAIDPDRRLVVVGANDGLLYAWDLDTRQRAWTFATGGEIKAPILVADGAAFFGSWDDRIYRVDLDEGKADWVVQTADYVMGGAALDPAGVVFIGGHDGILRALDARTGDPLWSFQTGGRIIGQPTVTSDAVLFGSFDRHLYALDKHSGELIWRHEAVGPVTSAPLVRDGLIVFADRSIGGDFGRLYALHPTVSL